MTTSASQQNETKISGGGGIGDWIPDRPTKTLQQQQQQAQRYFFKPQGVRLKKMFLFETKSRFYLAGLNTTRNRYRLLKLDRSTMELNIFEDKAEYTPSEFKQLMEMINLGNQSSGGLRKVCVAYGILGFIRFLAGYYLILITKKKKAGLIGGHPIYNIGAISHYFIPDKELTRFELPSREQERSNRYKSLFLGMDLTNFYFSYTYDLTHTLQYNYLTSSGNLGDYDQRFVWNQYLLSPLVQSTEQSSPWILPTIHGYYSQAKFTVYGRTFNISLIARRSRHFAGTRYLKRGVNEQGYVANDVETEQIVHEVSTGTLHTSAHFTSYTQIRGSIPLFWGQEHSTLAPKPPICVQRSDPFYTATIRHFQDLFLRFGSPIFVLNLIKGKEKQPREKILRKAYAKAVAQLNKWLPEENRIIYVDYDFHDAKSKKLDVLEHMSKITEASLGKTGFFHCGKQLYCNELRKKREDIGGIQFPASGDNKVNLRIQTGLIRSNCIDSLDRTNAAQFVIGKVVFGHQLYALGLTDDPDLDFDDDVVELLMEMYQGMGNRLAIQYGGSHLAHTMNSYRKKTLASSSRDLLESFKRYYSNSFTDAEKQDSINIFLGHFIPYQERVDLWELDSDYYLHFKRDETLRKPLLLCNTKWWETPLQEFEKVHMAPTKADWPSKTSLRPSPSTSCFDDTDAFKIFYHPRRMTWFDKEFAHSFNKPVRPATIEQKKKKEGTDAQAKSEEEFNAVYGIKRWFEYDDHKKAKKMEKTASTTGNDVVTQVTPNEDAAWKYYGVKINTTCPDEELYRGWLSMESLIPHPQSNKKEHSGSSSSITTNKTEPSLSKRANQEEVSFAYYQSVVDESRSTKRLADPNNPQYQEVESTFSHYNYDLETMMRCLRVTPENLDKYHFMATSAPSTRYPTG